MRKVDPWFSPDLRKAAFSFSSTPSSDLSIPETTQPKKRMRTVAPRPAKSKAMTALKESDEENNEPPSSFSVGRAPDPRLTSRFVTHRKRPLAPVLAQKHTNKRVSVALNHTLNSSDDFLPSFSRNKRLVSKKPSCIEDSDAHRNRKSTHKRIALVEVSFNDSDDQHVAAKRPLLSSTPSVVSRQLLHLPEPSLSEISSLSFDDLQQPTKNNSAPGMVSSCGKRNRQPKPTRERVTEEREGEEESVVEVTARDGIKDQRKEGGVDGSSAQASADSGYTLHPLAKELKERCQTEEAVVMLNRINISDKLSSQSCQRKHGERISLNSSDFSVLATSQNTQTNSSVSSRLSSPPKPSLLPLYVSSSLSKSLNSPSHAEVQTSSPTCSNQPLIDRLKAECLMSCLTVGIPRLDLGGYISVQQEAALAPCFDSPYTCQNDNASSPILKVPEKCNISLKSPVNRGATETVVRRLSESFQPPVVLPPAALSVTRPPAVPKERTGASTSTGRKVCVSGLNVSRWSRKATGECNEKWRKKEGRTKATSGDSSSWGSMLSTGVETFAGASACGWLQGNSGTGLALTPLRMDQMNLSSILANLTPDTLTTTNWGRFKASLSLHKKKTAFPTPQRLAHLRTPGSRFTADNNLDPFASPVCTPLSRFTPSRLIQSTINSSMSQCDDDISDAEKVYQECQQNGPLSFSDCIPPSRMKLCTKIGEGTFGEVFSTKIDSNQTVALKIIPVEGSQKVNGEQQKTFAEILHEIIISKELSSLNVKEINRTDGFIGLNNLHCVRGRYPEALLKAWDKFDCQKGSENDRPDFFDDEQLFLILEFEFGGSDLENMKGKLSSMAQAKSVLHQVTAALAVAEEALDLHWGNILVKNTKQKHSEFILNGAVLSTETRGVHVNIIDYSLSRLEIDGLTVSCDISADEELFMGQGDYQFEIYRLMKKENKNCWSTYNPHSNVLWLHYLADKLLTMSYKAKAQSSQHKTLKSSLKSFHSEILNYGSATEALMHCKFFQ
ncbi:Serine/threonine-protein kinase haspin [Triplophysa tibetana]|uniref:Serine/threonine-protein kinase haspin n=1 Tax=Triplophysa tibetana TaxID=1572043 RepID=A0A5A9PL59_9TELE|nr:Serine/threonine-protein kinase haspin [Triplophysa tibetana]